MTEETKDGENEPVEPQKTGNEIKFSPGMTSVAINLLALAFYTIIFKFIDGGIIFDAFVIFFM